MNKGVVFTGVLSEEELNSCPGFPSEERMNQGPVACIECVQEIPCNPCESACRFSAIEIGEQITNLPVLHEEKCGGCGICAALCPGLAITIIDKTYSETESVIQFPFEYLPLPEVGDVVDAVGRDGAFVCKADVVSVKNPPSFAGTAIVGIAVPKEFTNTVRSMKRLKRK